MYLTLLCGPIYGGSSTYILAMFATNSVTVLSFIIFMYVVPYTSALIDNLHKFTAPSKHPWRRTWPITLVSARARARERERERASVRGVSAREECARARVSVINDCVHRSC